MAAWSASPARRSALRSPTPPRLAATGRKASPSCCTAFRRTAAAGTGWRPPLPGAATGSWRRPARLFPRGPAGRPVRVPDSELAADVLALADAAGAERFHLAGHDWGAALAWYVARRHPGRVTSLAALSVPHPKAFARALITGSQAARRGTWPPASCPGCPSVRSAAGAARPSATPWCAPGLIRPARTATPPGPGPGRAARSAQLVPGHAVQPAPAAGPVRVPAMFAWGNRDRFLSRAAAELCGHYVTGPYRFTELATPRTGCPNKPPTRWRRCSRSTSRRHPDSWACRRIPTRNPPTRLPVVITGRDIHPAHLHPSPVRPK